MTIAGVNEISARSPRQIERTPMVPFWALIAAIGLVLAIATYPLYGQAYVVSLLGKFLCYAIFALSIDLIWGFTGILSLGQIGRAHV